MKVLVAVDGSPGSDSCLEVLLDHRLQQDEIRVVSVYAAGLHRLTPNTLPESKARAAVEIALQKLTQKHGAANLSSAVLEGDAVRSLLTVCKEWQADMLFIGAHSNSPKPTLGSVTAALLTAINCSVTIVKINRLKQDSESIRYIICVDAMAEELGVMKYSRMWHNQGQFLLLSIIQPPIDRGSENPKKDAAIFLEGLNRRHQQMSSLMQRLKSYLRGLMPESTVAITTIEDLDIPAAILTTAKEWKADVLVMYPHEHDGLDKFLVGSVSQEVAQRSQCAVQLIR